MGSKSRIAKYIVPIIQSYIDETNAKIYIEPFVGGANVIDKIKCKHRYGNDINHYLIELFKHLDEISTLPDEISKSEYAKVRKAYQDHTQKYPDWYIGAVGFLASYNGKFFGGRAGIVTTKIGTVRNYYDEAKRNLITQIPTLKGIKFSEGDYRKLKQDLNGCVIYCDIPYRNTTGYQEEFDHSAFWKWAEQLSKNNVVLISEQTAPENWKSIWSQQVKRTLDNASRLDIMEQLYILDNKD